MLLLLRFQSDLTFSDADSNFFFNETGLIDSSTLLKSTVATKFKVCEEQRISSLRVLRFTKNDRPAASVSSSTHSHPVRSSMTYSSMTWWLDGVLDADTVELLPAAWFPDLFDSLEAEEEFVLLSAFALALAAFFARFSAFFWSLFSFDFWRRLFLQNCKYIRRKTACNLLNNDIIIK